MRTIRIALALTLLAACSKSDDNKSSTTTAKAGEGTASGTAAGKASGTAATKPGTTPTTPTADPVAAAGVEAGPVTHDKDEGAAATLSKMDGTVEVRRLGETEYKPAKADDALYPGDQVRTADGATATITLADESTIEVAETSTVAIASRDGSADPASSAAVLAGVARFTVTPRAPGEGAFKVYTPSGIVMTKGTVYGVGVAADGQARIGVEEGQVDIVGLAALDAEPVALDAGNATTFAADGSVGASAAWTTDDWGQWRDDADAQVDANAAVVAHASMLADLSAQLEGAYGDMQASADEYADFEDKAAASAQANATADYQTIAPDGAATIEASFDLAGAIEALTWSYAGHAELATDIYTRHPDEVTAWADIEPRTDAAILWPKRFEVTATGYLEPLRGQYYIHHPRGRAHAAFVGVTVPAFYAQTEIAAPDPTAVRARVRSHIWIEPEVHVTAQARAVWIAAPRPDWRAKVRVHVAPPRGAVAWYVRPAGAHGTIMVGTPVKAAWHSKIKVAPPETRAQMGAHFHVKVAIGTRVKVAPPDLDAAARARIKVVDHRGEDTIKVVDHRTDATVGAAGNVTVKVTDHRDDVKDVGGKVVVKVNDHRDDAANVGVKVKDHRDDVKGKVEGGVKVKVKVNVPKPPPPPKVKVKASGSVKVGGKIKI